MNAASSLRASAEALDLVGEHENARQCRLWAVHADDPRFGDALYRHFATQSAERATRKLIEFNHSQEAGCQSNKRAGVTR